MSDGVLVIAEAGVNHDGLLARALELVDAAADAGADVVKFQTFRPEALVTDTAPQADYQIRNAGDAGSQLAMLRRLALSPDDHFALVERCAERGVEFLSSPFDSASATFLVETLGLRRIKIGSGELTNAPLLLQLARTDCDLIVSTGMSTLPEVREALGVLAFGTSHTREPAGRADFALPPESLAALRERVTLLHCTTEYPCPPEQVNLRAMDTMARELGLPVGYSDHTLGIHVAVAAVARGATVIEKHLTLDRGLSGPDHAASLEPRDLAALVAAVRETSRALGSPAKQPTEAEMRNAPVARRSIVAARPIRAGQTLSIDDLTTKRPGTGRSPMELWDLVGTAADRDYAPDEVIR